jgi:hypothetical protein
MRHLILGYRTPKNRGFRHLRIMNILRRTLHRMAWFILAMNLSACSQMPAQATLSEQASATPFPTSTTTQIPKPTFTPSPQPTHLPTDEPLFYDPQGWYSLKIPRGWKTTGSPGAFKGDDGYVETGYLPEQRFMPTSMDICQWQANIETKQIYWMTITERPNWCRLNTMPGVSPAENMVIIENSAVKNEQRYIFIRADASHIDEIAGTFHWLRPVATAYPEEQPAFTRSSDTAFWAAAVPLPAGLTEKEYPLPPEMQNIDPSRNIFSIPPGAPRSEWKPDGMIQLGPTWETVNQQIHPFGYEFKSETREHLYQLFKDGKLLIEHIYQLPAVYQFTTPASERLVFKVNALINPDLDSPYIDLKNTVVYLVQNEGGSVWENGLPNPNDPQRAPIFTGTELLWVQVRDYARVDVKTERRETRFSFSTYNGAGMPIFGFRSWNGHWLLQVSDFLIQDGTILNEKYGFEEVFNWGLLKDKPYFFFRKGPFVGISFDGQFLLLTYQEVPHNKCCGLVSNNPSNDGKSVRFFARKNGIWTYVVIEAN